MSRRVRQLLVSVALAAVFAVPATAAAPALRVTPTVAARGTVVTFTGSGCLPGDTVYLISGLFPGHAYGLGAISTRVRPNGHFLRSFRVRPTTPRRRYTITARCGGGNLGVAVHLRVR